MPRTPARFTQADIARALRAVEQTGLQMAVEIGLDGVIRIVPYEKKSSPDVGGNRASNAYRKPIIL